MTKMNRNSQNFTTNAYACGWASCAANNSVVVRMGTVFAVSIFVLSIISISIISISIIGLRLYGLIIMLIMGTIEYLKKQKVKTKTVLVF